MESEATADAAKGRPVGPVALLRLGLLLAPWAFIAYLFRDPDELGDAFRDASIAPMLGGLALTLAGLVATAWLWARLVGHLSREVAVPDTPHLLRAFARSWLARYLPGKLWAYGARMVHTDAEVTPRRILATSLVDEAALLVGSATALGLAMWVWAAAGPETGVPVLAAGMAFLVLAMTRLDRLSRVGLRLAARPVPERWRAAAEEMQQAADDPGLGLRASALFTLGYLIANVAVASGFVLVVVSVADIATADFPLLVGGYSLAAVLGIVAFFAPAGLGVREGVLAGFITPVVGGPVAASLAILIRVVGVVADGVFLAVIEMGLRVTSSGSAPATAAKGDPGAADPTAGPLRRG